MTATLGELLTAVSDQLDYVIGQVTDVPVHFVAGLFRAAETPSVNVYPTARGLTQSFAGFGDLYDAWPMTIRVAVSPADIEAGEDLLWQFMDEGTDLSIIGALEYDHTLSGVADDVVWGDWAGYQDIFLPDQAGTFIGASLPILVAKAHS